MTDGLDRCLELEPKCESSIRADGLNGPEAFGMVGGGDRNGPGPPLPSSIGPELEPGRLRLRAIGLATPLLPSSSDNHRSRSSSSSPANEAIRLALCRVAILKGTLVVGVHCRWDEEDDAVGSNGVPCVDWGDRTTVEGGEWSCRSRTSLRG